MMKLIFLINYCKLIDKLQLLASANHTSTDIKMSKTQLFKMIQLGGFLGRCLFMSITKNWITTNEKCNSTIS